MGSIARGVMLSAARIMVPRFFSTKNWTNKRAHGWTTINRTNLLGRYCMMGQATNWTMIRRINTRAALYTCWLQISSCALVLLVSITVVLTSSRTRRARAHRQCLAIQFQLETNGTTTNQGSIQLRCSTSVPTPSTSPRQCSPWIQKKMVRRRGTRTPLSD